MLAFNHKMEGQIVMKEIANCFRKYFDFKGNSSRREYSCFLVFKILVGFASFLLTGVFGYENLPSIVYLIALAAWLLQIGTIIPFVAVVVRRLHDIGRSGWFALILLVPLASLILKFVLVFPKSVRAAGEGAKGGTEDKPTSCVIFVLIPMLVLPIFVLASIGIGAQEPIKEKVGQLQREAMLRDMYVYLQAYQNDFGSFPSVQPKDTRDELGGGVRDLYPLAYTGRMDDKTLNEMLHPPGSQFDKFSKELRPEEFDRNHIGWSYNSCARIGSDDPLMADQGVSSGYLDLTSRDSGIKPLSKKSVIVLLANGQVERISVHRKSGKLLGDVVKDWSVLKD